MNPNLNQAIHTPFLQQVNNSKNKFLKTWTKTSPISRIAASAANESLNHHKETLEKKNNPDPRMLAKKGGKHLFRGHQMKITKKKSRYKDLWNTATINQ